LKAQIEKLRLALDLVEPAVPRKPATAILSRVRLDGGMAMATDMEKSIVVSGVYEDGAGEGLCLDHRTLSNVLAQLPGYEFLSISVENKRATLTTLNTQTSMDAAPATDYPAVPKPKGENETAVDGDAFTKALATVLDYVASPNPLTRSSAKKRGQQPAAPNPVMTAVCVTLGDKPEVAAVDGFRLSWIPLPFKLPGEGNILIPADSVSALLHLWKKAPKPPELGGVLDPAKVATAKRLMRLQYGKERLAVSFGNVSLFTILTQGTFPNYRKRIPEAGTSSVTFLAPELDRAVKLVLETAKEGSGIIRLSWAEKELHVEGRDGDLVSSTSVPAVCKGEGKVAFHHRYLQEYLHGKEGIVTLEGSGPTAPGLLYYRGVADTVLMPMFTDQDAGTKPPEAAKPEQAEEQEPEEPTPAEPEDLPPETEETEGPEEPADPQQ